MKSEARIIYIIVFLFTPIVLLSQNYFQQEVNYKIKVTLDDTLHRLYGYEELEYKNNSPDELRFIYFHLWPNGYCCDTTALAKEQNYWREKGYFRNNKTNGFIDSLDFKVNGKKVKRVIDKTNPDICKIILNKPLKSGETITITTPFRVKLPSGYISRLGHIKQAYTITQWYPKPAVYDRYGWHQMPYLGQGEFYSEFGCFDVSITLPDNYRVAATGNLQTGSERKFLDSLAIATSKINHFDENKNNFPPSSKRMKTVRFTESNIHDFAWFADKRFNVLKSGVKLPGSGRNVTTWLFFPDTQANLWKGAAEYINDALYYYSLWFGEYPYDNCTAVHAPLGAGGGMEYPTITVIGNSSDTMMLETVIAHEAGHNWFYGILGSNEREHAWMDEGINSFGEERYVMTKYPENRLYDMGDMAPWLIRLLGVENLQYNAFHYLAYLFVARKNTDQPLSLNAQDFTSINYSALVYAKTAVLFDYLKLYLGDELFDKTMHKYFDEWKFKHPYPVDLQKIFEENTGKRLDWFFDDIIKTTKKPDYKLKRFKDNRLLVKNKRYLNCPVPITGFDKNGNKLFSFSAEGFKGKKELTIPENDNLHKLIIDPDRQMPELYPGNNSIRTTGILKKAKPIKLRLLGTIEKPQYCQINITPVAGWNYYNKFMLGAVVYSTPLPLPKFEYRIMPVYSFGTKSLAGMGTLRLNTIPRASSKLRMVSYYLNGMQYAYDGKSGKNFRKLAAGAEIRFKRKHQKVPVDHYLNFELSGATNIFTTFVDKYYYGDYKPFKSMNYDTSKYRLFYSAAYKYVNSKKNPFILDIEVKGSTDHIRGLLTTKYIYEYEYRKYIDFRFFTGYIYTFKDKDLPFDFFISPSGTSGFLDYDYENIYLARMELPNNHNILANQFVDNYGGFGIYTPYGMTDEWLSSFNITMDIPFIPSFIPVRLYGAVSISKSMFFELGKYVTNQQIKSFFDTGVKLSILRNVFEIYFPVTASKLIMDYSNKITSNYWQKIRFTLKIKKLNPFKIIKDFDF